MRDDLSNRIEEAQMRAKKWQGETMTKLDKYQQLLKIILQQLGILNITEQCDQINLPKSSATPMEHSIPLQPMIHTNNSQQKTSVAQLVSCVTDMFWSRSRHDHEKRILSITLTVTNFSFNQGHDHGKSRKANYIH